MDPVIENVTTCRCCGAENSAPLDVKKSFYLSNFDQVITIGYAICIECQFIFQQQYVGDKFLEAYYRESPMLRRLNPTKYEVDQNIRQGGFLNQHVHLFGAKVLEIGAHFGSFLEHLHDKFNCSVYYDELSDEAVSTLKKNSKLTDRYSVEAPKKFDILVLRHILEHIFEAHEFLKSLLSILENNGHLFIEVPDWSNLDQCTDPLIFEHLSQFNTSGLVTLLYRSGWQLEALEKSINENDPATPNRVQRLILKPNKLPLAGDRQIIKQFNMFAEQHLSGWCKQLNIIIGGNKGKRIALYPASHLTFDAIINSDLTQTDGVSVIGMFDIDEKKHGKNYLGLTVYPAQALCEKKPDLILIFTMAYEQEARESFVDMGLNCPVISITELVESSYKK